MTIKIPELALVLLVGPSGAGKSTFAQKHFKPTEVISSDTCRGMVSDDPNDQAASKEAFEVLRFIAEKRLARGLLTVIDATNVQPEARAPLVEMARAQHCLTVALVLDLPEQICHERNASRPDRAFGSHVVRAQKGQLRRGLRGLKRQGIRQAHTFHTVEEVDAAVIERQPLWNNKRAEHGPFDIIGDIHGCRSELDSLLLELGYDSITFRHPQGRRVIFLGDLVDRGPDIPGVLRGVMGMVADGSALCVPGNHEIKLQKALTGAQVKVTHGLAESLAQLERETAEFRGNVVDFIDRLVSHYVLDDGKLVVAHAGLKASMQGRASALVRQFAMYGDTTGETDKLGLPVRFDWASEYRGAAMVVYGHTPVPEPEWLNNTINVDTGCVFGGKLTALRYPERELVSVPAEKVWFEPVRPLVPEVGEARGAQHQHDDVLDLEDISGKRVVHTRLIPTITIREENATAALEAMSRFAANPKWLVYLPPTMSPSETTRDGALLEHPAQAFDYFRKEGVKVVVCQEKHMGSRAVVVVCRDQAVARKRFGVAEDESGICYTRTGRRFFDDPALESALISRVRDAATAAGIWDDLGTDWLVLDCELMPWSAKAKELIRVQYASVGAAGRGALNEVVSALGQAVGRAASEKERTDLQELLDRSVERQSAAHRFTEAYRRYCWPFDSLDDLRLAPFHLLASEGAVHSDKDHRWHMEKLGKLCDAGGPFLFATRHVEVDLSDEGSEAIATSWWEALTASGGEGMVVKPLDFLTRGTRGFVQPAVKCRGPEYLRIIYGPDYLSPEHLAKLRVRGLGAKRSLAGREFALGLEGLDRFVRKEPLRKVHECVFGVLALESEPVDPRL